LEKGALRMSRKAIFLDRDGVLIYDPGYLREISQVKILPYVFFALKKLQELGYMLVIISNQSVVARGMSCEKDVGKIDAYIKKIFEEKGVVLSKSYYCFHHPDFTGRCNCRKPEPGLFLEAICKLTIDIAKSWVIGDKITDIEAGRRAGCKRLILMPTNLTTWDENRINYGNKYKTADNLSQAVDIIEGDTL